jgi:hypothetical protein
MNKEFIPYEQALELKELGFDEPCVGYYENDVLILCYDSKQDYELLLNCATPLYQQAFRWFREKYNLKGYVEPVEYLDGTPDTYHWSIFNNCNSGDDQLTHEEAELACLVKLIEIIEEKQK